MAKHTKATLKKLEQLYKQISYTVRYEKGSFSSGYCLVQDQRVVVVNKFFKTESRCEALIEILQQIEFEEDLLDKPSRRFLSSLYTQT